MNVYPFLTFLHHFDMCLTWGWFLAPPDRTSVYNLIFYKFELSNLLILKNHELAFKINKIYIYLLLGINQWAFINRFRVLTLVTCLKQTEESITFIQKSWILNWKVGLQLWTPTATFLKLCSLNILHASTKYMYMIGGVKKQAKNTT